MASTERKVSTPQSLQSLAVGGRIKEALLSLRHAYITRGLPTLINDHLGNDLGCAEAKQIAETVGKQAPIRSLDPEFWPALKGIARLHPTEKQWNEISAGIRYSLSNKSSSTTDYLNVVHSILKMAGSGRAFDNYQEASAAVRERGEDLTFWSRTFLKFLSTHQPRDLLFSAGLSSDIIHTCLHLGRDEIPKYYEALDKLSKSSRRMIALRILQKASCEPTPTHERSENFKRLIAPQVVTNLFLNRPRQELVHLYKRVVDAYLVEGADLVDTTNLFSEIASLPPLAAARTTFLQEALPRIIEHQLSRGGRVDKSIQVALKVAADHPEAYEFYLRTLKSVRPESFDLELIPLRLFADKTPPDFWPDYIQLTEKIELRFHGEKGQEYVADSIVQCLLHTDDRKRMLRQLEAAISDRKVVSIDDLLHAVNEIDDKELVRNLISNPDPEKRKAASKLLAFSKYYDGPPFIFGSAEHTNASIQIAQHLERVLDLHFGFEALKFEHRALPDGTPSLRARYFYDVAENVYVLNCSNKHQFPGRGLIMHRPNPDFIFAPDPSNKDRFHRWKSGWAKDCFDFFGETTFIELRGMIIVMPPKHQSFVLHNVHYSLVVFNEHFHNEPGKTAWLVPTRLLECIKHAAIPLEDYVGYVTGYADINSLPLSPAAIIKASEELGQPILDIGHPTVLAGLANAYPTNSEPYFINEGLLHANSPNSGLPDSKGHIHHAFRAGATRFASDAVWEEAVAPLQKGHYLVESLSRRLFGLFDLNRVGSRAWHLGETISRWDFENPHRSDFSPEQVESEDEPPPQELYGVRESESTPQSQPLGPFAMRMFDECYKINRALRESGAPPSDYPILCLTDTLRTSMAPIAPVIDTLNLTYIFKGKWLSLPSYDLADQEERMEIWRNVILPQIYTRGCDISFCDRSGLVQ